MVFVLYCARRGGGSRTVLLVLWVLEPPGKPGNNLDYFSFLGALECVRVPVLSVVTHCLCICDIQ